MLTQVQLLDEMDDSTWHLLQQNLTGLTDAEVDWRPCLAANSIRWIIGHLTWFEEWAHDALAGQGRYLLDDRPQAYVDAHLAAVWARFEAARTLYRRRASGLSEADLARPVSLLKRDEMSLFALLQAHTAHLAGHRFQVRYIRGAYSRECGTRKADFDPW